MEYILVAVGCFVLGIIYNSGSKDKLDTQITKSLKEGKRVIICLDDEATIFEMMGSKISITKAVMDFNFDKESIELPVGAENAIRNDLGVGGFDESGNYHESGVAD